MLLAVGILLIALPALMHHAGAKASPAKAAVPAGGGLSQTERLIKLKSLLDSGVITQEEFDTKKTDIMG